MSGYGGYGGYGGYTSNPGAPPGGFHGPGGGRDLNTVQLARPDFSHLAAFEKNFYIEHPAVAARSDADVAAYRQLREIHVDGQGIPKPVVTFDEASFPGDLASAHRETLGSRSPDDGACDKVKALCNWLTLVSAFLQSMCSQRSRRLASQSPRPSRRRAGPWLCWGETWWAWLRRGLGRRCPTCCLQSCTSTHSPF